VWKVRVADNCLLYIKTVVLYVVFNVRYNNFISNCMHHLYNRICKLLVLPLSFCTEFRDNSRAVPQNVGRTMK
jgi:hypothetical protein